MAEQDGWSWSERDSETYRALAEIAVPRREEQLAALLCLLPFARDEAFRAVELGCGEGELARALLTAFPNARLTALDGSPSMRERASEMLAPFGDRAQVRPFDLESDDWFGHMDGAGCVVSSLVVHHLDAEGKRRLFGEARRRMGDRAALLLRTSRCRSALRRGGCSPTPTTPHAKSAPSRGRAIRRCMNAWLPSVGTTTATPTPPKRPRRWQANWRGFLRRALRARTAFGHTPAMRYMAATRARTRRPMAGWRSRTRWRRLGEFSNISVLKAYCKQDMLF